MRYNPTSVNAEKEKSRWIIFCLDAHGGASIEEKSGDWQDVGGEILLIC